MIYKKNIKQFLEVLHSGKNAIITVMKHKSKVEENPHEKFQNDLKHEDSITCKLKESLKYGK